MKRCVFAGSFDPITNGHLNIIEKCSKLFDEVLVALCVNPDKKYTFSIDSRLSCIKAVCEDFSNVKFVYHDGMLVDLLKKEKIVYNVRGIRNSADLEYENSMAVINKDMYPDLVTVYLPCDDGFSHISSTVVRQLMSCGESVERYVPEKALNILKKEIK